MRTLIQAVIEDQGELPRAFHGDSAPVYRDKAVEEILAEHEIKYSISVGQKHENQVLESFNNSFKGKVARKIPEKTTLKERKLICREFTKAKLKLNNKAQSKNSNIIKKLFSSLWLKQNAL